MCNALRNSVQKMKNRKNCPILPIYYRQTTLIEFVFRFLKLSKFYGITHLFRINRLTNMSQKMNPNDNIQILKLKLYQDSIALKKVLKWEKNNLKTY